MRLQLGGRLLPMVGRVRMYVCGITPYAVTQLGHAATYVWADALDRVLSWHGHTVSIARNITDVDDVLFAEARRRGESPTMLATLQRAAFEATMTTLRVRTPDLQPSAANHIGHVIALASALLDQERAYVRGGTVYARTGSAYLRAGIDRAEALARAEEYHDHPDDPDKDDPLDVVLWQETADDEVSWPSPWGKGRPGWHAECAAMVLALYGPSVDIHCGGADLAFPHHAAEAELAEAATGVMPFARAWLRAGTVMVGGEKMAKSTGNLVLVEDLLADYPAAALRLLILDRPWAEPWNWSRDALDAAAAELDDLYAAAARPDAALSGSAAIPARLLEDLDVPTALAMAIEDGGQAARTLIEMLALS
ncbi:MAG: cysteine--tRNA ligase [Jatrophihabitans sp.]|uniref:cysteine--tRNA ligase n=1 Tax=Jatrophihabitans sp. TaxID=1932789 RepID=UPI003F7F1C5B